MTLYALTPEHTAQLKPWADRWIANALSTAPMTEADKLETTNALKALYAACQLNPDPRVVFVSSPFAGAYVAGTVLALQAAGRKRLPADYSAWPEEARVLAAAVVAASGLATRGAAPALTLCQPTAEEQRVSWVRDGYGASVAYTLAGQAGLKAASDVHVARDGGNQWSAYTSYLSFFRHIAQLNLDYSKWQWYERLAEISGVRYVLPDFAVVSDRPATLTLDPQSRPHGEADMACRFRDGTGWWYWHGVPVSPYVVERPAEITLDEIKATANEELRRVLRERYGDLRYLRDSGAKLIDADHEQARKGAAPRMLVEDDQGERWLIGTDGGTGRNYVMSTLRTAKSCREAHEARTGFDEAKIVNKS